MNISDFNDCADEIAKVLDKYLPREVEDGEGVDLINEMVKDQIELNKKLQRKENIQMEINGGSK
tara:strand:+ start:513 stop:704 length:192 start_codon:yes stop_codon:yes gene_type:complete